MVIEARLYVTSVSPCGSFNKPQEMFVQMETQNDAPVLFKTTLLVQSRKKRKNMTPYLRMVWLITDCNLKNSGPLFSNFQVFCPSKNHYMSKPIMRWSSLKGSILSFRWRSKTNLCIKVFFS